MNQARPAAPLAFRTHWLALAPARAADDLEHAVEDAFAGEATAFMAFLLANGLGPLWHQALHSRQWQGRVPPEAQETLNLSRFAAAALYLLQSAELRRIDHLFAAQGIAYAAIKGAHVRELAYDDPSLRPADDVDIIVSAGQRVAAARALVGAGFHYHPAPDNISHEASFVKGRVTIDLHWNTFRPGRSRVDVTDALVARRVRVAGFWGLSDTDAVFLMLTHPAFFKYVCSPNMALCRVADFMFWTRRRAVDWAGLAALLRDTGLNSAAWTVSSWFALLGAAVPADFLAQISPGKARVRYLRYWLERDLPTQWFKRRPLLIQLGFTLFLHDRPADAGRAVCGWLRAYRRRRDDPFAALAAP